MTAVTQPRLAMRFRGALKNLTQADRARLTNRSLVTSDDVVQAVRAIISRVRCSGDTALIELARTFDNADLETIEVPGDAIAAAHDDMNAGLRSAMLRSARNIERVHRDALPIRTRTVVEKGVTVERRPDPLRRVGIYAPGGKAAYASSVLMSAIPARVAGVEEIIMCSPPAPDGLPSPEVLAAAMIAGVDRVFAAGGAGAIAAMAIGTASVPRVDKVVGPGNAYVAEAKMQLLFDVAADSPAGPSELLVIADYSADPATVAREVVAQAEHDARAVVIVLAVGEKTAATIESAIVSLLSSQPRAEIIETALSSRGGIVVVLDLDEAISAANDFAPEHLMIAAREAEHLAERVVSAGAIFVGQTSSVAFGDYLTGGNHVLPTGGMSRAYSGLSTLDFVRWTSIQTVTSAGAASLSADTVVFATAEGLSAHAAVARAWAKT